MRPASFVVAFLVLLLAVPCVALAEGEAHELASLVGQLTEVKERVQNTGTQIRDLQKANYLVDPMPTYPPKKKPDLARLIHTAIEHYNDVRIAQGTFITELATDLEGTKEIDRNHYQEEMNDINEKYVQLRAAYGYAYVSTAKQHPAGWAETGKALVEQLFSHDLIEHVLDVFKGDRAERKKLAEEIRQLTIEPFRPYVPSVFPKTEG